ncbi:prolyl oligopeptidase family serine peptidase [Piscinibacter sp.]|uniref:prolyl oligopeptidase family serine peptidase n=1 Tax=Piscinibacter sp. TaxID=1903157 RepID=UPI002CADD826|nr:prolyl oligopeptidase family serine peptidase [Albitalea sp.]HUG23060.1 prolyl oligopeptidase family serine peptidase [Albitalea sp.]
MRLLARFLAGLMLTAALPAALAADPTAPATPRADVTDTYHGVTVTDPYRWMEDMNHPQWKAWLKTQADHAAAVLARIPGRDTLRQRIAELSDAGESVFALERRGARVFYLKSEPGHDSPRLYVRRNLGAPERLLLDPHAVPRQPGRHSIDFHTPSPDGRLVAVGLSVGGSEDSVLRVFDVASGRFLREAIRGAGLNDGVSWRPDQRSFFYNRTPPAGADGGAERYNKSAVYLHVLGRDPAKDPAVFGWGVTPSRRFDAPDVPYVFTTPGSPWAHAVVLHGDAPERSSYVAPLSKVNGPDTPWRRVIDPADAVLHATLAGNRLFAISTRGASRGRLVSHDLGRPTRAPVEVIPQGQAVLRRTALTSDALVIEALDGGVSRLTRVPLGRGTPAALPLPFDAIVRDFEGEPTSADLLVRMEGWTRAASIHRIAADGRATDTGLQKPLPLDTSGIEARRVMVKSADGTAIPLSILMRKGLALDGSHPTILFGYGAYGISMEPRFSAQRLAWLERGGVLAVAHVRGGGEFGADWHNAGRVIHGNKQNTIGDFIACAEYLVSTGYTSRAKLAGTGGSAGGITIGAAITQRPELFAAAQSAVGLSDMLRMELTPNGPPNIAEFGTVANPDHFKTMFAISPYHRVTDGTPYPGVIVTTGANDPRVDAWLPGKMAARLQAATTSGRPVLLRVDFDAGHGMGSTKSQYVSELADVWSFFLWQMGEPGFQPAP